MEDLNFFGKYFNKRPEGSPEISSGLQNQLGQNKFATMTGNMANLFFNGPRGEQMRQGNTAHLAGLAGQGDALATAVRDEENAAMQAALGTPAPAAPGTLPGIPGRPNSQATPGNTLTSLAAPGPQANALDPATRDPLEAYGIMDSVKNMINPQFPDAQVPDGMKFTESATMPNGVKVTTRLDPVQNALSKGGAGTGGGTAVNPPSRQDQVQVQKTKEALAGGQGPAPFNQAGGVPQTFSPAAYGAGLWGAQGRDPRKELTAIASAEADTRLANIKAYREMNPQAVDKTTVKMSRLVNGRPSTIEVPWAQQENYAAAGYQVGEIPDPIEKEGFKVPMMTPLGTRVDVPLERAQEAMELHGYTNAPPEADDPPEMPTDVKTFQAVHGRMPSSPQEFLEFKNQMSPAGMKANREAGQEALFQEQVATLTPTQQMDAGVRMNWDTGQAWQDQITGGYKRVASFEEAMGKRGGPVALQKLGEGFDEVGELVDLFNDPEVASQFSQYEQGSSGGLMSLPFQSVERTVNSFLQWFQGKGITVNPKTTGAIARVARLAAEERSRLFGASLTESEKSSATPFLPNAGESLATIRGKLGALHEELGDIMRGRLRTWSRSADVSEFIRSYVREEPFQFMTRKKRETPGHATANRGRIKTPTW